jgi:hypothetical protein
MGTGFMVRSKGTSARHACAFKHSWHQNNSLKSHDNIIYPATRPRNGTFAFIQIHYSDAMMRREELVTMHIEDKATIHQLAKYAGKKHCPICNMQLSN